MSRLEILDHQSVGLKINRMVYEIWERNADEKEIYILGISGVGQQLATILFENLQKISDLEIHLGVIEIDKLNLEQTIASSFSNLKGKNVVVVDDVANSGKTLLYGLKPILDQFPKKIEVAVLVNRMHKNFPVRPDIIGHELSTTLQENIIVSVNEYGKISVFIE